MKLSWFFVLLLLAFVAIFSVQNAEVITVRFFLWQTAVSAALVIQLAALCGALTGLVIGVFSRRPAPRTSAAEPVGTAVPPERGPDGLPR